MRQALTSLFKIRPGEETKVIQFVALFLLIQAGTAIGITTSDSLFLLTVGGENLPKVYILVPAVMLLYIPLSSFLTTKLGLGRVFSLTLYAVVICGVALWSMLTFLGSLEPILYAAKVYSAVAFIALYSLSWSYTYQFFNILEGKRLFAFFTGGSALGAIIGGVLINILTLFMPVTGLYLVWAALAAGAIPVFNWIARTRKVIEDEQIEEEESGSVLQQTLRLGGVIRKSHFVLIILAVLFSAQVLTTLNEYQYLDIFAKAYPDEAQLAGLFGKLYIGVNIFNLFISMFVFNRMVLRFGVRNIALILPVVYIIVFSWLYLNYGLMAGFLGFFAYQGLMIAIDYDNTNLLLNGLPSEAQAQVRTFIEGLAEPFATATAGIFLLFFAANMERETISLIGVVGAAIFLLFVLGLRSSYVGAMISNLKKSWLDFSSNASRLVSGLGESDLAFVEGHARSLDPELAPMAQEIFWLNNQPAAAEAILDFMSHANPETRRKAEPLFSRLLKTEDAELLRIILEWLDRDEARIDIKLIQEISTCGLPQKKYLARLMKAPGSREQSAAALQLLKSWKLDERSEGLEMFEQLLAAEDSSSVASAIRGIGQTGDERYAHFSAPYLNDPDPEIREEALLSVNHLVTPAIRPPVADTARCDPRWRPGATCQRDGLARQNRRRAICFASADDGGNLHSRRKPQSGNRGRVCRAPRRAHGCFRFAWPQLPVPRPRHRRPGARQSIIYPI